jgi:dTMP kinase
LGRLPFRNNLMDKGKFITIEGGEGTGKSTQIKKLVERLKGECLDVVQTREPGGSKGAEKIRDLLIGGSADNWDPISELLLLYAARRNHVEEVILPAISEGKWVICDRFVDSSMAYQGIAQGLGTTLINRLTDLTLEGFLPDLTLILDIPVEIGLERAKSVEINKYEEMDISFHNQVRIAFIEIANQNPERCALIDAVGDINKITNDAWDVIKGRLLEKL